MARQLQLQTVCAADQNSRKWSVRRPGIQNTFGCLAVVRMGACGYCTVEFIELTSAVPFTLAQLKEFTLARGFIPSFHGATTLPMPSHPSGGGCPCPLALSRVLAVLVLRAQLPDAYSRFRQLHVTTEFVHSGNLTP